MKLNLKTSSVIALILAASTAPALMLGMNPSALSDFAERKTQAATQVESKSALAQGADATFVTTLQLLGKLPEDLQQKIYSFDKTITPLKSIAYNESITNMATYQDATGWKAICGSGIRRIGLRILDLTTGKFIKSLTHDEAFSTMQVAVYRDNTGPKAVSGGTHNQLLIWDLITGQLIHTIITSRADDEYINHIAVYQDESGWKAVTTCDAGHLTIWDLTTYQWRITEVGHTAEWNHRLITGLALYQGEFGWKALTSSRDKSIKQWDLATGKPHTIFVDQHLPTTAVAAYNDHGWKALFTYHTYILVWDLEANKLIKQFDNKEYVIDSIAIFEEDSCWMAALRGSGANNIIYLNLTTNEMSQSPEGHTNFLLDLKAYKARAGWKFISRGLDKTLRTWRYASEVETMKAEEHNAHRAGKIIEKINQNIGGKTSEILRKIIFEYAKPE